MGKNKKILKGIIETAQKMFQDELDKISGLEKRKEFLLEALKDNPELLTLAHVKELFKNNNLEGHDKALLLRSYFALDGTTRWLIENVKEYNG